MNKESLILILQALFMVGSVVFFIWYYVWWYTASCKDIKDSIVQTIPKRCVLIKED